MNDYLPAVEIEPSQPAKASVVWLHGLGADGHDFEPIVPELRLPEDLAIRFVFPHAPNRPITWNGGYVMPGWYDIFGIGQGFPEDAAGIHASQQAIGRLIEREHARGVPYSRIVLAGFSQGGAIVLQTGLRYPQRLAGIMALSTYLPLASTLGAERAPANQDVPIYMGHGTFDNVVPYALGQWSCETLRAQAYAVEWRSYAMAHSVCAEQIADLSAWLRRCLTFSAE
jgi:phospholipase/carboxylesterase